MNFKSQSLLARDHYSKQSILRTTVITFSNNIILAQIKMTSSTLLTVRNSRLISYFYLFFNRKRKRIKCIHMKEVGIPILLGFEQLVVNCSHNYTVIILYLCVESKT
jgi:hypothetical protein